MELFVPNRLHLCSILVLILSKVSLSGAACSLPSSLRGTWKRHHDGTDFTISATAVTGFPFKYFITSISDFDCLMNSGNKYVLSGKFDSNRTPYYYLLCWQLVEVTSNAFILYELTSTNTLNANIIPTSGGKALKQSDTVTIGAVCDLAASTTLFTALVKQGAAPTDVAVLCPSNLFATFDYGCAGSSVDFCTDRQTAIIEQNGCSTIRQATGGALSCMGSASHNGFTYINLYNHDAPNSVICMRYTAASNGKVTATYYSGDCTTATQPGTDISLVPTETCPLSSGDSSEAGAGVIAGSILGVIAVACVGVVAVYYFMKLKTKRSSIKVHAESKVVAPKYSPPTQIVTSSSATTNNTTTNNNNNDNDKANLPTFPDISQASRQNQLPPLPHKEAPGEPLRA